MEYVDVHERISLKFNVKMKEAFDLISQTVQERLEWDRVKVSRLKMNEIFEDFFSFFFAFS